MLTAPSLELHWKRARETLPLTCDCESGDICASHERLVEALHEAWLAGIEAVAEHFDLRHERLRKAAMGTQNPEENTRLASFAAEARATAERIRRVPVDLAREARVREGSC